MADNGDIGYTDVEDIVDLGAPLASDKIVKVGKICEEINAEVNLVLTRMEFVLPIVAPLSIDWLRGTKKFGAGSITLDFLMGQSTEEDNTRADRWWERYQERMAELVDSGGLLLDAPIGTTDQSDPLTVPVASSAANKNIRNRSKLRFTQRAVADQIENMKIIRRSRHDWSRIVERF